MASEVCKWPLARHEGRLHNASITQKRDMAINITFFCHFKLQNEGDSLGRCINLLNDVLCTFLYHFCLLMRSLRRSNRAVPGVVEVNSPTR